MAKFYKEIPKLFQLEKYQDLDKFNACEWFYALSGRQRIYDYIQDPTLIDTVEELSNEDRKKVLMQAIEKVLKNPMSVNFDFDYIRKIPQFLKININNVQVDDLTLYLLDDDIKSVVSDCFNNFFDYGLGFKFNYFFNKKIQLIIDIGVGGVNIYCKEIVENFISKLKGINKNFFHYLDSKGLNIIFEEFELNEFSIFLREISGKVSLEDIVFDFLKKYDDLNYYFEYDSRRGVLGIGIQGDQLLDLCDFKYDEDVGILKEEIGNFLGGLDVSIETIAAHDESVRIFVFGDDEDSEDFMWVDMYRYPPAKLMKNKDLNYFSSAANVGDQNMSVIDSLFEENGIINKYAEVPLVINPLFPDEFIVDSIKEFLLRIREENNIGYSKIIGEKLLKTWSRYRVLAYMDLWLWSKIFLNENKKFSFSTYHKAIFPDNARNQSTIEKEVKPLTDEIFSNISSEMFHYEEKGKHKSISIMEQLQIFAAIEKAKYKSSLNHHH